MAWRLNWKPFAPHIRHLESFLFPFSILSRQLKINYQCSNQEWTYKCVYCLMEWMDNTFVYSLSPTEADEVIWVGGHLICLLMLFINQCFPSSCHITFSHSQYTDIMTITIKRLTESFLWINVICSLSLNHSKGSRWYNSCSKALNEMEIAE